MTLFNSIKNLRLCRYQGQSDEARIGLVTDEDSIVDLTALGIQRMDELLESNDIEERIFKLLKEKLKKIELKEVKLLVPLEMQEVWAAGVTYSMSKKAREIKIDGKLDSKIPININDNTTEKITRSTNIKNYNKIYRTNIINDQPYGEDFLGYDKYARALSYVLLSEHIRPHPGTSW